MPQQPGFEVRMAPNIARTSRSAFTDPYKLSRGARTVKGKKMTRPVPFDRPVAEPDDIGAEGELLRLRS